MDAKYERMQQWKAGFLALVLLVSMALIIPATGSFADWYNELNADHTTATSIFSGLDTIDTTNGYNMDGTTAVRFATAAFEAPKSYFYWYNTSTTHAPLNKNNITALTAGVPTVTGNSTADQVMNATTAAPNTNGWPYWVIVFDYTAWDAYYDNAVRIKLNFTGLHTGTASSTLGDWTQVINLYWGDTANLVYSATVAAEDSTYEIDIDLDVNDLRLAIVDHGRLAGFLTLKVTREDAVISLNGCAISGYSATNLVSRDDALGVGMMAIGVLGFVGAIIVQPSISLNNLLSRGKKTGKGRGA